MRFVRHVGVAALVLSAVSARAEAQLPTVQQVFDKFATAVGGRDAWAKVQGRSDKGTADITFAGISGTYERHSGAPNKMRMIIDLGMAKVDQGFDGTVGWAAQPTGQAQRMPADQEKSLSESMQVGAAFLDVSRFAKASVDAKETFDGVECYKVSITSKLGEERTEYFEVATGLRRGAVTKTPMGEQKSMFRDYKAFDGKQIATKVVQVTPQGDVILTTAEVSFTPPDPSLFKAPDGIAK
jgi:hypothetical protein